MARIKKTDTKELVETVVDKFDGYIDYDFANKQIKQANLTTEVSKDIVKKISKWALNGASDKEIAEKLLLEEQQFKILCNVCPVLVMIMQNSRELADVVLSGSLFQTAIGGQKIKEQQVVKLNDFDEDGNKTGEHIEIVTIEKELPPNPMLLKFMAENKLSEKFGKDKGDSDKEMDKVVGTLTEKQLKVLTTYDGK